LQHLWLCDANDYARGLGRICGAALSFTPLSFGVPLHGNEERFRLPMKNTLRLIALVLLTAPVAQCAEPVAKQFLRYIYGADDISLTNICHPSDDLWMLRGAKNTNALTALDVEKIESKRTGVLSGVLVLTFTSLSCATV
jgi:hypothetical protein